MVQRLHVGEFVNEALNPVQAKRFFCPECLDGNLILRSYKGEGLFLVCSNAQAYTCNHRRRFSLADAKTLVRLHDLRCPKGHPMTARTGPKGTPFIGCENYPQCQETQTFSLLAGF